MCPGVHLRELADRARTSYPDRFAGAWLEHGPSFTLVLSFTGSGSNLDLGHVLGGSPAPIRVLADAQWSLDQLLAGLDKLRPNLVRDHEEMGIEIDVTTNSLRMVGPTAIDAAGLARLSANAGGIQVYLQQTPPERLSHTYGGRRLTRQDNGMNACTTTFSIRNVVTGRTGVLTAGHCADSLVYWEDSIINYNITKFGERWDADQDWQWHDTPHDEFPQFWSGINWRPVTATAPRLEMVGDFVCHYGITTGRSCGTITTIHYVSVGCNGEPCAAVWVRVEGPDLACSGGDSGGPWYNTTTAYGIHHSGASIGPYPGQCSFATFNSIGAIQGPNNNLEVMLAS